MEYTTNERELQLKKVIIDDKSKPIPTRPPVTIIYCNPPPQLSELTVDMKNVDAHALSKLNTFDGKYLSKIMQQGESRVGDRYYELQPYSMPKVDKSIIVTRLDICQEFTLEKGGTTFRWCQGKVIEVSDEKNMKI